MFVAEFLLVSIDECIAEYIEEFDADGTSPALDVENIGEDRAVLDIAYCESNKYMISSNKTRGT